MSFPRQVSAFCREAGFPLLPGSRVLCAVSGGADSMALLHYLWKLGCAVTAASFDHGIRPEGERDVDFVAGWCRERQIPCLTGRGDTPAAAKASGQTLEEAARQLRYAFLEDCAQRVQADYIATAHNADDQAETLLLRLLRGTGLKGLGGIPPRRGKIIRPFLRLTREEIEGYLNAHGIPHREDETNGDTRYTRNFLRHEVMPLLKSKNPSLSQALCRTAESLRQDEAWLEEETDRAAQALVRAGEEVSIPVRALLTLPRPIALRLLDRMSRMLDEEAILSHSQRQALLALAESDDPSAKISLPSPLQGRRVYDMLTLAAVRDGERSFQPAELKAGGRVRLSEVELELTCESVICPEEREAGSIYLKQCWETLTVRPRGEGDRLALPGRPEKRLKKLLIENKIPRHERDSIPVLEHEGRIAAVAGFGAGTEYQAAPGEPAWKITLNRRKREEVAL